jgi:hypothetical protein
MICLPAPVRGRSLLLAVAPGVALRDKPDYHAIKEVNVGNSYGPDFYAYTRSVLQGFPRTRNTRGG